MIVDWKEERAVSLVFSAQIQMIRQCTKHCTVLGSRSDREWKASLAAISASASERVITPSMAAISCGHSLRMICTACCAEPTLTPKGLFAASPSSGETSWTGRSAMTAEAALRVSLMNTSAE